MERMDAGMSATTDTPAFTSDYLGTFLSWVHGKDGAMGIRETGDAFIQGIYSALLAHDPPLIREKGYGLFYLTDEGRAAAAKASGGK